MIDDYNNHSGIPAYDADTRMPADERMPASEKMPREESVPAEEEYSFDEFNVNRAPRRESEPDRHRSLKKTFLKPVAALVLTGAVIVASLGIDPLSMAADRPEPPAVTAEPGGLEPEPTAEPVPSSVPTAEPSAEPVPTAEPTPTEGPVETEPPEEDEDVFPSLGNLDPDFAGDYAWSEEGSEEYVRFISGGAENFIYLQKGGAWDFYDPEGQLVAGNAGATYYKSSNVLRLNGFSADMLDVNLMGNGFTIELTGDSHIGSVSIWGAMYAGSVTFTGSGSLTIDGGLYLNCEASPSCIIVKRGVTLDISGDPAVVVGDTTLEGGIFMSKYLKLTGGEIVNFADENDVYEGSRLYVYTVVNEDGDPATHVRIEPADE
ncbi:MAG: hypothetical protein J6P71_07370 [Oscillospiraceae bacterium]|nr:hypothetical protein [Oscillospiraceae bacterium]